MPETNEKFYLEAVRQIKTAILKSRYLAARLANREQLKLYFGVGGYVSANSRHGKWGTGAIETISRELQTELPGLRGFSAGNIKKMRLFYEEWCPFSNRSLPTNDLDTPANRHLTSDEIAADSNRQLMTDEFPDFEIAAKRSATTNDLSEHDMEFFFAVGFTHHMEILFKCKDIEERWYYIRQCAARFWTVDTLKDHLKADDFHHAGTLPNNFALTMPDEKQVGRAVRAFKDEYLLDYVNIEDAADETDVDERVLENALVGQIKRFIQSLGADFCFVGNQYRLVVEEQEFFVDLLFYHRSLRSLVAVELKRGAFKPAYLGQLNFYLSALDDKVRHPDENKSIGLLLCKEAKRGVVELAIRDYNKPMGVAVYRLGTDIPHPYQTLIPLIDGVEKILNTGDEEHA